MDDLWTGTPGLDAMLEYYPEDWITQFPGSESKSGRLRPGSTTLLVGPPGSGKSTIGLQFLFRDFGFPGTKESLKPSSKPVFVTFDLTEDAFSSVLKNSWERYWKPDERFKPKHSVTKCIEGLVLRQAHIDPNLVVAQLRECIAGGGPKRLVIDGLSEWIATYPLSEQPLILDAVLSSVRDVQSDGAALTVFVIYEADTSNQLIAPATYGIPAENIVVLKQVHLQDANRQLIYIAKAAGQAHDRSVREVIFRSNSPLSIVAGFDEFTGLLENQPRPAQVLLQFFEENSAERRWNKWVLKRLKGVRPLEFRLLNFFRSEIGQTLEASKQPTSLLPSDLKIMSVDEWWLQRNVRAEQGVIKAGAVLGLDHLWLDADPASSGPHWSDFWRFELEKVLTEVSPVEPLQGGANDSVQNRETPMMLAVPGYMDFGLFCINTRWLISDSVPGTLLGQIAETKHALNEARAALLPKRHVETRKQKHPELDNLTTWTEGNSVKRLRRHQKRKLWQWLLARLPRAWVPLSWEPGKDVFSHGTQQPHRKKSVHASRMSLLELADAYLTEPSEEKPWLFAFDTSTPENCVSMWFELAWAFGAEENFMTPNTADLSEHPATHALVLLQELVLRGLMPARSTVEESVRALFSRHWYSTLRQHSVSEADRDLQLGLPFWPVGKNTTDMWCRALVDAGDRLERTLSRTVKALNGAGMQKEEAEGETSREKLCAALADNRSQNPDRKQIATRARTQNLINQINSSTTWLKAILENNETRTSLQSPPRQTHSSGSKRLQTKTLIRSISADYRDLLEHFQSHVLRLRMLWSALEDQQDLSSVLENWRNEPFSIPQCRMMKETSNYKLLSPTLTGYCCSGSWLYAIQRRSRSLTLAHDLLAELTSRKAAEKRAELGAGLPARKDFYATAGDRPVPGAEHLSWRDLLRFAGSRSRQRSGVLGSGPNTVALHHLIAERLVDLLQAAAVDRPRPSESLQPALERALQRAKALMGEVWGSEGMRNPHRISRASRS